MAATLAAAERRNVRDISEVAERIARTDSRAMRPADAGWIDLTFPQAAGIVSVRDNGTQTEAYFTSSSLPVGACVTGLTIVPSGDALPTDTYCVWGPQSGSITMELWNGAFPDGWQPGTIRFRVFVKETSGRITEANGYAPLRSCCSSNGPQVTSIAVSADGSQLMVRGAFDAGPMVGINGIPVAVISGTAATSSAGTPTSIQGTIVVPNTVGLNDGNGVLTLCFQGSCSQTFFHIPPSLASGGKG